MFTYSQFVTGEAGAALANARKVATGELNFVDELYELEFVRAVQGMLFIRFSPTDRQMANLVVMNGNKVQVVAILHGDMKPGIIINEYIEQVVQDIPAFVPPKDWGEPIPLDDLLQSGVVKKV